MNYGSSNPCEPDRLAGNGFVRWVGIFLLVTWTECFSWGQNPPTIYVYDTNVSTFELDSLMASVSGIVARTSPEVFMAEGQSNNNGDPEFWLNQFVAKQPGTQVVWQRNAPWYLDRYKDQLSGYVVYDAASINQATSVAGALGAVMVHESLLGGSIGAALNGAGLTQLEDVRGRSSNWVYDTYEQHFNRDLIFRQQPNFSHQLRDFAILNRGFVFNETAADRDRFLAGQNDHSRVFGWGYQNSEDEFFRSASQNNLMAVPADHLRSTAAPSRWDVAVPTQGYEANVNEATQPGKHYVAFVMSDGDNVQWLTNDYARDPRWFGSPLRGSFPMTFDLSPSLLDVHPVAFDYLYEQAAADSQPTLFATAGGYGINYPSQVPDIGGFVTATSAAMARVDQRTLSVLDTQYDRGVMEQIVADPQLLGLMVKTGPAYAGRNGAIDWHEGKPIVSVKYTLWDGFDSPNEIISALNSAPRDPFNDIDSFSIVNVHPWSTSTSGGGQGDPMSNLAYIVQNLSSGVNVVTLDDLMIQLRNNFGSAVGSRWGENVVANGDFEVAAVDGNGNPVSQPRDWFFATVAGATEWVAGFDSDGEGTRAAAIRSANADWRSEGFVAQPGERWRFSFDFMFNEVPDGSGFRADVRFFDQPGSSAGFVGETTMFFDGTYYGDGVWQSFVTDLTVPSSGLFGDVRLSTFFGPFASGELLLDNVSIIRLSAASDADLDGNGVIDCLDVDALVAEIVTQSHSADFDLTGDGLVNTADLDFWLAEAGNVNLGPGATYLYGDANLDGTVDTSDFNLWNANKFTVTSGWCSGDFTADGVVDIADFNRWNANKFTQSTAASVPEPNSALASWPLVLLLLRYLGHRT